VGRLLRKTDIDELNEEVKFRSGYEKTPYFLCLVGRKVEGDEKMDVG
jgi:hypothetical protein